MAKEIVAGRYFECGCCGHYHPEGWYGDCRDDDHRFMASELEDENCNPLSGVILVDLEEETESDNDCHCDNCGKKIPPEEFDAGEGLCIPCIRAIN